jgi:hypothetical protein
MDKSSAISPRAVVRVLAAGIAVVGALIGASAATGQTSLAFEQQVALPGSPFAVRTTPDGQWAFTSLLGPTIGIAVLKRINHTIRG